MNIPNIHDDARLAKCFSTIQEAETLKKQAIEILKQSNELFKQAETELQAYLDELKTSYSKQEAKYNEEFEKLEREYIMLIHSFCNENGCIEEKREERDNYKTCIICGKTTALEFSSLPLSSFTHRHVHYRTASCPSIVYQRPNRAKSKKIFEEVASSDTNPKLQKMAQRLLEIPLEIDTKNAELDKFKQFFKDLCHKFGHLRLHQEYGDNFVYHSCDCCGEEW